jgi:hypothetical protein
MEFFISEPNVTRYAPSDTRLLDLRAVPDSEGKHLRVTLELSPFLQRPNIEINLTDSSGHQVVSASIIEPVGWRLEITLHIRKLNLSVGNYNLTAGLFYPKLGEVDRRMLVIKIPVHPE